MKKWVKHLIECHCVLRIYKKENNTFFHKFPVYSKLNKNNQVIKKLAKCNNCNSLHLIYDICKSELKGGKDDSIMIQTKDDISLSLPDKLANILFKLGCDISIWEHCLDAIEEERWNEIVVLRREIIDEKQHVKILKILSENKFKVENKIINDMFVLE